MIINIKIDKKCNVPQYFFKLSKKRCDLDFEDLLHTNGQPLFDFKELVSNRNIDIWRITFNPERLFGTEPIVSDFKIIIQGESMWQLKGYRERKVIELCEGLRANYTVESGFELEMLITNVKPNLL